jgi:hypothetical protein
MLGPQLVETQQKLPKEPRHEVQAQAPALEQAQQREQAPAQVLQRAQDEHQRASLQPKQLGHVDQ